MADPFEGYDLDNPELPQAIRKKALSSGGYPYDKKMNDADYEREMLSVQTQLAALQQDQIKTGRRIVIVFEGRDAAGKGGAIAVYLKYLNPRLNMTVALPKPSDRERTQWYFQRYVDWLPAASEQVLFDRSWYNRAGVEPVMGFCTEQQTTQFLQEAPRFERMLVNDGIHLFKFWMAIGREMQLKRFHDRRHDPLKIWKLSPIDLKALDKFDEYSVARDHMFEATHTDFAPWRVILSNDKSRAHLAILRSVLLAIDYEGKEEKEIGEIDHRIALSPETFRQGHHHM